MTPDQLAQALEALARIQQQSCAQIARQADLINQLAGCVQILADRVSALEAGHRKELH